MKLIGRILIILGVTWLIVMGLNWLRMQNMLPINPDTARSERFVDGEHREGFMRPGRGFGEFGERGERHFEEPSLDGVGDVLGTLTKIGIITGIVVVIDRILRSTSQRMRRSAMFGES
jgi:hypothetical protein